MKKLLIVLVLIGLVGSAGAQLPMTLPAQRNTIYRLSTGSAWFSKIAIPNDKRDTTAGLWVMDTGGLLGVGCSLKVNSGGSLTMGILSSADGINYSYEDSTLLANAWTTAGFKWFRCNLPYTNNVRITLSNHGSDTIWVKFLHNSTIGRN